MHLKKKSGLFPLLSLCLLCPALYADDSNALIANYNDIKQSEDIEEAPDVPLKTENSMSGRGDAVSPTAFEHATDHYLEGYIQALVDMHYYEFRVLVSVKDHKVYLSNLPENELIANSIISFVSDVPGIKSVEVKKEFTPEEMEARKKYVETPQVDGVWFPQSTVLFQPLVADPRETTYSIAWRYGDHIVGKQAVAVAMGDEFPIFRWKDIFRWHGALQIGITGAVWAVFDFTHHIKNEWCELFNADYFFGIPLTYAVDRWSFRLRPYHISGHLGDEFLVVHPDHMFKRKNPSFEAIDFFASYQMSSGLRLYVGPGIIVHSDHTFPMKTFYIEYGTEYRFCGKKIYYHKLYGTPFIAAHVENWQCRDWNFDFTVKIGYEVSKIQGAGRKVRVFADYHHGYSYEGQFFKKRTDYGELGFSWGF